MSFLEKAFTDGFPILCTLDVGGMVLVRSQVMFLVIQKLNAYHLLCLGGTYNGEILVVWKLALWIYLTQRNGKGPMKYLGLTLIEWSILIILVGLVVGVWGLVL